MISESITPLASASSPCHYFRFYTFEIGHVSAPRSVAGLTSLFVSQLYCIRCFLVYPPARNSTQLLLHKWSFSPMSTCHRVTRQVRPRHSPFIGSIFRLGSVYARASQYPSCRHVVSTVFVQVVLRSARSLHAYCILLFQFTSRHAVTSLRRSARDVCTI